MKTQSLALAAAAATAASATYMCPAELSSKDAASIAYGYKVQGLLKAYYNSVDVNAEYFESSLPNGKEMAANGKTIGANMVTNVEGLTKQAELGGEGLMMLGKMLGLSPDECDYNLKKPEDGLAHLKNAFMLEATMCGAFIGLTDYVQAPEAAFLTARLSAEHGIHASAIRAAMQPVGFFPNSTMLTPAFTPEMILSEGDEVGMLGGWLNGCAKAPEAPCGGSVDIGMLTSTLSGQNGDNNCPNGGTMGTGYTNSTGTGPTGTGMNNSTTSAMPMPSGSSGPEPATGAASTMKASAFAASIAAGAAAFFM